MDVLIKLGSILFKISLIVTEIVCVKTPKKCCWPKVGGPQPCILVHYILKYFVSVLYGMAPKNKVQITLKISCES